MALPIDKLRTSVKTFVFIVLLLTLCGIIFVYSSSCIYALEKFGSDIYFLKRQLFYLIPSLAGFLLFAALPRERWQQYAPWLFLTSLALTAATQIPGLGSTVHGASRWLKMGPFGFQPSEVLKLFLIMYMGYFLDKKQNRIKSFLYTYLPFLVVLGVTSLVLLKQPDFGSVVTLFSTALVLFFVAECNLTYLVITALLACPAIIYLVLSQSYRLSRILIFLNPWSDPQGKGFQIIQSLIAIGSGQLWGLGISNSRQKFFYLPMQHTDFIFPIIAEEVGFVGSMVLLLLYACFLLFGLRVVLAFRNPFSFFTGLGFVVFLTIQAVINLMVACGLLPTKGLGLPFMSYGGTALICAWCMVGFVVNGVRAERFNTN